MTEFEIIFTILTLTTLTAKACLKLSCNLMPAR